MSDKLDMVNHTTSSLNQPLPKPGFEDMWSRLISRYNFETVYKTDLCRNIKLGFLHEVKNLMVERRQFGIDKYKTILQAFNGRNVINDLLAEQLDSLAYSEQVSLEHPELSELMLDWQKNTINEMQKLIAFKESKNASKKT